MPSTFTWLDYSDSDRRKMLDVIDAFREKETRDELGFGSVRDAFADLLFPGTSTIQTRARYFLFIPWIYSRLERERVRSSDIARQTRRDEVRLIDALLKGGETGIGAGVIGRYARGALQRLPSSVYWFGLGAWGIRLYPGAQEQYYSSLDRRYELLRAHRHARVEEDDTLDDVTLANWHPSLPEAPSDFLERSSFMLTPVEADYLSERIRLRARGSLLAFLVNADSVTATTDVPWEHPQAEATGDRLREQLAHARSFSEITHGAPLLYNLMLAELTQRQDLIEQYRDWLQHWAVQVESRMDALHVWNIARFWEIVDTTHANVPWPTRRFIERWIEAIRTPGAAADVADNRSLRQLIHDREVALKRRLSRLENPRARELWNGQSGTGQLSFRWAQTQRLIADIHAGLLAR